MATRLSVNATSGRPAVLAPRQASGMMRSAAGLAGARTVPVSSLNKAPRVSGLQGCRTFAVAQPETIKPSELTLPKALHGFTLVRDEFVAEYDSKVAVYRHDKTGAECMSVSNNDENKTFGVVFRTPVEDSTGIPHILEHSVLNGSKKYPLKEPFVELIKGSLHTFINAFTYPDRTCYPVASTNLQDFYNLCDVYMDAVFNPRCLQDPMVFAQEGWHYELDEPAGEMAYKGVVFNEMKGVYSQPDSIHYEAIQSELFPDNNYAVNSGGDPAVIPELTYERFKEFHGKFYHPSNARFWFYGDDPVDERLRRMAEYLDCYEPRTDIQSLVPPQPLFSEPKRVVNYYAAGAAEEQGEVPKAFVSVNWVLTADEFDLETEMAMGFLDYLLTGTSAAPLRKAMNDCGLGESIVGGGVDDTLRQPTYTIGLKGVDPENVDKVEHLVLEKFHEIAAAGFSQSSIDAAINTIEFSLRENNTGRFPRGLSMMLRSMGAWIYERDPYTPLRWQEPLAAFKARLEAGEDVFGDLLRKYILNNNHRVTVVTLPDAKLGEQIEAKEKQRLQEARSQMSAEEVERVVAETKALKKRQETPDSPEALASIPSLQLSDIPREVSTVPTELRTTGGATVLTHDLFTNDVLYLEAALDMKGVPTRLLPLVPLFCRCLTQMGTEKESFVELTERIGRATGGLSISPFVSDKRGAADPVALLMLRGKATAAKSGDLLDLMRDVLLTARLDDQPRFKQMVLETKSALEAGVVGSGHSFAAGRLAAQRSVAGWVDEQMGGLEYLFYVRELARRVDADWDGIKADLEAIRSAILGSKGAYVNMTADGALLERVFPQVEAFLGALPATPTGVAGERWAGALPRVNEAILVPTQVNYVGKAANLYEDAGYELHGSSYVINKHLGMSHIWDRVRVMGGAYGGFASFDSHSGLFTYASYRDPNLLYTVNAYDETVDFLRNIDLDSEALTKAIIGTIGEVDSYQLPDAKGYSAFMRHLLEVSDEERQTRRDQILGTTVADFRAFADVLDAVRGDAGRVVAVTSKGAVEKAHAEKPGFFEKMTNVM